MKRKAADIDKDRALSGLIEEAEDLTSIINAFARAERFAHHPYLLKARISEALTNPDLFAAERALDAVAREARAAWLRSVAGESASVLRSPTASEEERVARAHDGFGYERELCPESLEKRCVDFFDPPPAGWRQDHILFSSGQAALTAILLTLASGADGRLTVAHVGKYFETRSLIERSFARARLNEAVGVVVEPVACDGVFSTNDVVKTLNSAHAAKAVIVDATLTRRADGLRDALTQAPKDLTVLRLVSGLKMLQQGMELANVGIVSVYARHARRHAEFVSGLKRTRALIGAGLRFADTLALEAPFFLDRDATDRYEARVFAHNAALAAAVAEDNRLFETHQQPATAPYCTFIPRPDVRLSIEQHADQIETRAIERGAVFSRGGSFGFRGHRFDVVTPEDGSPAFIRVAMGSRSGPSLQAAVQIMREVASGRGE